MFKMRFLISSPEQPVKLAQKLATGKIAPSSSYFYGVVTNFGHHHAKITEGLRCGTPHLNVA